MATTVSRKVGASEFNAKINASPDVDKFDDEKLSGKKIKPILCSSKLPDTYSTQHHRFMFWPYSFGRYCFIEIPFLKDVLIDIHLIFSSTLVVYLLMRLLLSLSAMDFIKVFIRTLFRVWLLIFITFAISSSTERIGILLSLTFIFGYIEGLLDINKWLESSPSCPFLNTKDLAHNRRQSRTASC